jgi:hypothetical protein
LVASDEEPTEQDEPASPVPEAAAPITPAITVNGKRKSTSRNSKKKLLVSDPGNPYEAVLTFQSEETISPEDEDDDPMELDATMIASPLPVRSGELHFCRVHVCGCPTLLSNHIIAPNHRRTGSSIPASEPLVVSDSWYIMLTYISPSRSGRNKDIRIAKEDYTEADHTEAEQYQETQKVVPRKTALSSLGCCKLRREV